MELRVHAWLVPFTVVVACWSGCYGDLPIDGAHPCDACAPCQTCRPSGDGFLCVTPVDPRALTCGDDGHVYGVDACGARLERVFECVHGRCQGADAGAAACACEAGWGGDRCEACSGNRDPASDCTRCAGGWQGEACDVCPTGVDASGVCR